jgi:type VI secretion system protein ImpH
VRLLQSNFRQQPRIGHSTSPAQDPVRFAQSPALDFAASTIEAVQQKDPERPPVLYCRHFGLFGSNGPLPLCFTEYARERIQHHGDPTFAAFCNVFHHRLISFFFRAWADAQKTVDFDRPTDQHWSYFVGGLVGIGMDSLQNRGSVPDRAKLYFAGRHGATDAQCGRPGGHHSGFLWAPHGSADLCRPLARFARGFGVPAGWFTVHGHARPDDHCWRARLDVSDAFSPAPGADEFCRFQRMLPNGASFHRLCDWVREYAGEQYSWDVQLVLAKEEVPVVQLGKAGRLGWTTWLKTKPFERDADDLILQEAADEVVTIQVPPPAAAAMNN